MDRPNLSKDYLAGSAPEEWVPMRPADFYTENNIDLRWASKSPASIAKRRKVTLADGTRCLRPTAAGDWRGAGAALSRLGPGPCPYPAHPRRLPRHHRGRQRCAARVVMGASFIGLEVAASLRTRGLEVHVVAPEARPMERILAAEMGDFILALHEDHGVDFHLGEKVSAN